MTLKQATKQVIAELRKNHGGWFMAATSDENRQTQTLTHKHYNYDTIT